MWCNVHIENKFSINSHCNLNSSRENKSLEVGIQIFICPLFVFIPALFTITKRWKQLSVHQWMKSEPNGIYVCAWTIVQLEPPTHATTRTSHNDIVLSTAAQRQKGNHALARRVVRCSETDSGGGLPEAGERPGCSCWWVQSFCWQWWEVLEADGEDGRPAKLAFSVLCLQVQDCS